MSILILLALVPYSLTASGWIIQKCVRPEFRRHGVLTGVIATLIMFAVCWLVFLACLVATSLTVILWG